MRVETVELNERGARQIGSGVCQSALLDFDGPICPLFAGHAAQGVAPVLVDWLEGRGLRGLLADEQRRPLDPQAVLRAVRSATPTADVRTYLPSSASVIGDSPTDHEAARAAGVPFLGYVRNDRKTKLLRDAGVELIVESLEQVLQIVRSSAR